MPYDSYNICSTFTTFSYAAWRNIAISPVWDMSCSPICFVLRSELRSRLNRQKTGLMDLGTGLVAFVRSRSAGIEDRKPRDSTPLWPSFVQVVIAVNHANPGRAELLRPEAAYDATWPLGLYVRATAYQESVKRRGPFTPDLMVPPCADVQIASHVPTVFSNLLSVARDVSIPESGAFRRSS
jgi:hypothetical protein